MKAKRADSCRIIMSFMFIFGVKVDFPLDFAIVITVYERRD